MCTLQVPKGALTFFKPVLNVEWNGKRVANAYRLEDSYQIDDDSWICEALSAGSLHAEFRLDPYGHPVQIELFSLHDTPPGEPG